MLLFSNAKINLGLHVLNKREDGFHNIESVFYPIALYDIIEFNVTNEKKDFIFKNTGLIINSKPEDNLCIKAYLLLKENFNIPSLDIHIHKIIPFGAGLGGGSSNAAFMLKGLNEQFKLNIREEELIELADSLGSDCGFFIQNKPSLVTGKGEIMNPMNINLSDFEIVLVHPSIHVDTKTAYNNIKPKENHKPVDGIIMSELSLWKNQLTNDFEKPVFARFPEIKKIKTKLYENGAVYASMSGSGSSVYGIFKSKPKLKNLFPDNYFLWNSESI